MLEEKLGIPTTFIKDDGTWEEMTLTALLSTLKNRYNEQITEGHLEGKQLLDDIHYIEFIMNHKAGLNIRNRISHAHLDRNEYSPLKALLILSVYLRIATYQFAPAS